MTMRVFLDARSVDIWPYGVGRYAREMAARLPLARPEWEWVILRHGEDRIQSNGPMTTLWRNTAFVDYPRQQLMLDEAIAATRPGLVHALWFPVPENFDGPSVITIQDAISMKGYPEFMTEHGLVQNYWQQRTCQAATHVIAPSFYTLRDLASIYEYPASQITMIPHAPSDAFSRVTKADIETCRSKYNLPDPYIYASAHSRTSYKNAVLVPQALEILRAQGLTVPPLVSTGNRKPESRPGWIQLPLLNDQELAAIMAGATMMIYPSKAEGFGFPPLEAMACGTPVITSNASSLPEIGGDAVLYMDPNSAVELAASIRALMESPGTRKRLSELGRKRAALFTWDRTVSETLALYDQLISAPRPARPAHTDWKTASGTFPASQNANQVLAHLEQRRRQHPRNPDTLRELGKIYKAQERWPEARQAFEDMLQAARDAKAQDHQRSALFHLGECYSQLGLRDKARAHLLECLKICPTHQAAPLLLKKLGQEPSLTICP